MLTVKKFGAAFNLSYGGYFAALVGIIIAVVTIVVIPPDIDLAGKCSRHKMFNYFHSIVYWLIIDHKSIIDDDDGNSTVTKVVASTMATISGTTIDPTPDDEDDEIPEHEKRDEINDSK